MLPIVPPNPTVADESPVYRSSKDCMGRAVRSERCGMRRERCRGLGVWRMLEDRNVSSRPISSQGYQNTHAGILHVSSHIHPFSVHPRVDVSDFIDMQFAKREDGVFTNVAAFS
jgi:hypothetical protein